MSAKKHKNVTASQNFIPNNDRCMMIEVYYLSGTFITAQKNNVPKRRLPYNRRSVFQNIKRLKTTFKNNVSKRKVF